MRKINHRRRWVAWVISFVLVVPMGLYFPVSAQAVPLQASDFTITEADLAFILKQIQISEAHATSETRPGTSVLGTGPNDVPDPKFPWGLRELDGRNNNLSSGIDATTDREYKNFGAANQTFPRITPGVFNNPYTAAPYSGNIVDTQPRIISNLIVDQSKTNPAAYASAIIKTDPVDPTSPLQKGGGSYEILNTPPAGLAASPYNSLFTFFGQFFDHGLDLVGKDSTAKVDLPLPDGDVLCPTPQTCSAGTMHLSRTFGQNNSSVAGINRTTPWVDQNQTYASHPSKQVFLREYETGTGKPLATGKLLIGPSMGGIATWANVKANARNNLGIELNDSDVVDVPFILTDEFGRFLRGSNGYPQMKQTDGSAVRARSCDPADPCKTIQEGPWKAVKTGHAFLDDIGPGSLDAHYVTGDGRGNENIGLTAIHTVFHAEHNRVTNDIKSILDKSTNASLTSGFKNSSGWGYGERLFQAAKFVNEMEYQHLVFDTFVRRIEPSIHAFTTYNPAIYPDITAEFASAVYRFGHSMLNEQVLRTNSNGATNDKSLFLSFLNPTEFTKSSSSTYYANASEAAGAIARGSTMQVGNEIDEFVTGALRNALVGLPLDLASLNIARGRDAGLPTLNKMRESLFAKTQDNSLAPYTTWFEFGRRLRHQESLVNFIAAYGVHYSLSGTDAQKRAAATILKDDPTFMASNSGLDNIDLWIGGLAEARGFAAGMLGTTFTYIFRTQMENLQDGDRFYYLSRLAGTNLLNEVANNTLADMFIRNTDVRNVPADFFSAVDQVITLPDATGTGVSGSANNATYSGTKNVVFVGTDSNDTMRSDSGHDTLRGFSGNDQIDGDDGADTVDGGPGNDVIIDTGISGGDIARGGPGDDFISTSTGPDVNEGGAGNDTFVLGSGGTAVAAGSGNDIVVGGPGNDIVTGDEGDDWIEGSNGADNLDGDAVLPPLGIDLIKFGDDVVFGGSGTDLLFGGGGMDIFGGGDSTPSSTPDDYVGGTGFDWVSYYPTSSKPVVVDLSLAARNPGDVLQSNMDLFADGDVEAISGGAGNDQITGDIRTSLSLIPGASDALTTLDSVKITGLTDGSRPLLYTAIPGVGDGTKGNILIGGSGSDIINGQAGNDLIDGDAYLDVWLEQTCGGTAKAPATTIADLIRAGTIEIGNNCTASKVTIKRAITFSSTSDTDIAIFSGNFSQYTISCLTLSGSNCDLYRVSGPDGDDVVRNIETLRFADRDVAMASSLTATVAPTAPLSVTATPISTGALQVRWQQPATGNGVLTYTARAWGNNKGSGKAISCQIVSIQWCTISGLANGTTYWIDVIAANPIGTSAASTPRITAIPVALSVPNPPTSVVATPLAGAANISWVAPVNTGGSAISSYTATAKLVGVASGSCNPTTAVLQCTISGLTNGTTYTIEVIATNSIGSSAPATTTVTPASDPGPSAPQNVAVSPGNTVANVSWQAPASPGATGATVSFYMAKAYSASTGGTQISSCTASAPTLLCTISTPALVNGTTYWVSVVATNSNGTAGVESARISVTPQAVATLPGAPRSVTTSGGTGTWTTNWVAPLSNGGSAITSYRVGLWSKISGGKQVTFCTWTPAQGPTLTCTNSAARGSYFVDVVAINLIGTGPASTPRLPVTIN